MEPPGAYLAGRDSVRSDEFAGKVRALRPTLGCWKAEALSVLGSLALPRAESASFRSGRRHVACCGSEMGVLGKRRAGGLRSWLQKRWRLRASEACTGLPAARRRVIEAVFR
jgi:hypothetical protein